MKHRSKKHYVMMIIFVAFALLGATRADAHKMTIFVDTDRWVINGEVYFAGGVKGSNLTVNITSPEGIAIGKTKTDDNGRFSFWSDQNCEHVLTVDVGDGHGAKITVMPFVMQVNQQGNNSSLRVRDIVGGVGFFLGIIGIGSYIAAKKKASKLAS